MLFYISSLTCILLFHSSLLSNSQLGRDVVSYAMSYFDRIVPKYGINDTLVQLVAMTCLYLAIKVHCTKKISVGAMCSLSRGSFRYDQVVKMERLVLQGLNWYLSPATPHLFLEVFFTAAAAASSQSMNDDTTILNEVKETAQYLLELSVCDNFFTDTLPSSIARAAISAAMDIVARPIHVNIQLEDLLLDDDPIMVDKCSLRLSQIYNMVAKQENGGDDAADVPQEILASSSMRQISPTSVFHHFSTE